MGWHWLSPPSTVISTLPPPGVEFHATGYVLLPSVPSMASSNGDTARTLNPSEHQKLGVHDPLFTTSAWTAERASV